MSHPRPLIMTVEKFLRETGMPATRFGRLAVRDPRLVGDLRNGRTPGSRMQCRVEHFMNIARCMPANQAASAAVTRQDTAR